MWFPVEILEKILLKCDGKTLKSCRLVRPEWDNIICYLSKKTNLWKWICVEEIPPKELIDYLAQYSDLDDEKWEKIYNNWAAWQDSNENINYDIVHSPVDIPRISCIACSGQFIAVGSDDGRVRLYTENWSLLYSARHKAVRVKKISFIRGEGKDNVKLGLVIAYARALIIDYFNGRDSDTIILEDVRDHSVYKNFICYERVRGIISIAELTNSKQLKEIWFTRIYSPSYPTCLNIWNGVCTVLINDEIKYVCYNEPNLTPVKNLEKRTSLKSSWNLLVDRSYQMLRDDLIISLSKADYSNEEFIEFFILNSRKTYSRKLFKTWDALQSFITCVFVYGNTLIIGVDCGNVYFYHVPCWKNFDIRKYTKKIIIGKHPIISIDVNEEENKRKFYITSSFCVHEVTGYDPKNN